MVALTPWGLGRDSDRIAPCAAPGVGNGVNPGDADGQHDPADINWLVAPLVDGQADVVIGACPLRVSPARRLAGAGSRPFRGLLLFQTG